MSDSESQPMSGDRRKAAHRVDASRVWAVLIGINAYPSSSNCSLLHGCVNDVEKMEEFLTKDLGVPEGHIQCLLTVTTPTRKNIIDTLLGLSTNLQIRQGDNIIIYFAGHGSSYDLSGFYKADDISAVGSIEALCPVDRRTASATDLCIPDISDRELNIILAEISREKGNHITLILDC
ncbi:caspase domain-containing protein, partial [Armillaria nabsnona]